ncbi:3-isopropylmalate dehydratase [Sorangium sp. So ce281]|uniref:LeuD/DmdB family oxidoreductase small subunit n=1 Tax=unclassified Sorangium TaxID=2621164 RepID=UPI003F62D433
MKISGSVFQIPQEMWDDVNTDLILPGAYLRVPEEELGSHAFEGVIPDFPRLAQTRPILVAGSNMGCGSSREQAPKALLGCGVRLVIAASFGGIFFRNAFNLGLMLLKVPDIEVLRTLCTDAHLEVDPEQGTVVRSSGDMLRVSPLPPHQLRIVQAGGILQLIRNNPGAFE